MLNDRPLSEENSAAQMLREAARVERCHTMPHHGSYSNGLHAHDMMTLLLVLYPTASRGLLVACLLHHVPERYTGSLPEAMKRADGDFSKRLAIVELKLNRILQLNLNLTEAERCWLRGLNMAVQFLWAKEQIAMGNQNAQALVGQLASWFSHNAIPTEMKKFLESHQWTRTPDEFPTSLKGDGA